MKFNTGTVEQIFKLLCIISTLVDSEESNLGPLHYELDAITTKLRRQRLIVCFAWELHSIRDEMLCQSFPFGGFPSLA